MTNESKSVNWTFWNIWSSYATYYFGRVNLGIVIPALLATHQNLSLYNVGLVSSGFLLAYAIGQFIHGQISEKFNPILYISLGLILSGLANLFLGFAASFFILLLVGEIIDGFVQSMGWSSSVRANALFQKKEKRERSSVLLGMSYQVGHSVTWLVSAFAVGAWGWRAGFFVAAFFLIVRGITLLKLKVKIPIPEKKKKIKENIKATLTPSIIIAGIALGLLNMVRYGVITWIPLYLFTSGGYLVEEMGKVGMKVFLIPIFGVLGTAVFFYSKKNKDFLSILFCIGLAISFIIFPFVGGFWTLVVLFVGSFFTYGPHVFLVGTLPTRFSKKNIVAASCGFINGIGYIGSTLTGIVVPFIIGYFGGWEYVFYFWAIEAILIAILIAFLYLSTNAGKKLDRKIVYTYVCGDILHKGHLNYLKKAKEQGDYLIVGVLTKEAIMEKKPEPTMEFSERLELVKNLKQVDEVIPQTTYSPLSNVKGINPDILVESDSHEEQPANEYIKSYGGEVVVVPYYKFQSSSKIKEIIKEN